MASVATLIGSAPEVVVGVSSWMVCSVGMLVFNKEAIRRFPLECLLVALQMLVTSLWMVGPCRRSLHFGSARDVLRWCMVVPFFCGMLLSSILALKNAPMSVVVTFRTLSPLPAMLVERFIYPEPLRINWQTIASIGVMLLGVLLYCRDLAPGEAAGIIWVVVNSFFAICDRLLQRYMLAKDQNPVDISKTGVTLLNNAVGMVPLLVAAAFVQEYGKVPEVLSKMDAFSYCVVGLTCVVSVGISYCGIWAQSMISATTFLVLVNVNKFAVIFIEVIVPNGKVITRTQIAGSCIAVAGGALYSKAREQVELKRAEKSQEDKPIMSAAAKTTGGEAAKNV